MEIESAALLLNKELKHNGWFIAAGVGVFDGKDCICLYTDNIKKAKETGAPEFWKDFPVLIKKMTRARLV